MRYNKERGIQYKRALGIIIFLLLAISGVVHSQIPFTQEMSDDPSKTPSHYFNIDEMVDSTCKSTMFYTVGTFDREKILPGLKTIIESNGFLLTLQETAPEIVGLQFDEKNLMGSSIRIFGSAPDDRWTENDQACQIELLYKKLDDSVLPPDQIEKYDAIINKLIKEFYTLFKQNRIIKPGDIVYD